MGMKTPETEIPTKAIWVCFLSLPPTLTANNNVGSLEFLRSLFPLCTDREIPTKSEEAGERDAYHKLDHSFLTLTLDLSFGAPLHPMAQEL